MTELHFPFDLIYRTKENLENYKGPYEITQLINSALGLIILPYEKIIKKNPKDRNCQGTQGNTSGKWWNKKVSQIPELSFLNNKIGYNDYNQFLDITVAKIRHGLAHQNIHFVNNNNKIEKIIIWNCPLGNKPKDLEIEFETGEFRDFVLYIANSYIQAHIDDLITAWKNTQDQEKRNEIDKQAKDTLEDKDYKRFKQQVLPGTS